MSYINIFYEEPDPDRWMKFDRYPRRWIRRILRGKTKAGGVMMVALELIKGLEQLNIPIDSMITNMPENTLTN